jgi:hypothetical protein
MRCCCAACAADGGLDCCASAGATAMAATKTTVNGKRCILPPTWFCPRMTCNAGTRQTIPLAAFLQRHLGACDTKPTLIRVSRSSCASAESCTRHTTDAFGRCSKTYPSFWPLIACFMSPTITIKMPPPAPPATICPMIEPMSSPPAAAAPAPAPAPAPKMAPMTCAPMPPPTTPAMLLPTTPRSNCFSSDPVMLPPAAPAISWIIKPIAPPHMTNSPRFTLQLFDELEVALVPQWCQIGERPPLSWRHPSSRTSRLRAH